MKSLKIQTKKFSVVIVPETAKLPNKDSDLILNERKRKQLDSSIYESFMHPKMFKTKKINVENNSIKMLKTTVQQKKLITSPVKNDTVKKVKHKFSLY